MALFTLLSLRIVRIRIILFFRQMFVPLDRVYHKKMQSKVQLYIIKKDAFALKQGPIKGVPKFIFT